MTPTLMDPISLVLIFVLAGLLYYLFFRSPQADLHRRLGLNVVTEAELRAHVRETSPLTQLQRRRTLLIGIGATGGALLGFIMTLLLGVSPILAIPFVVAGTILPIVLQPGKANPRKQMAKAMPRFLLNLSTVLKESENLYVAFRLATQEEEGPVFAHLRARLDDVNVRVSLGEILDSLADYYQYEPFTSLVRVLQQTERTGVPSDRAVADIEKHLFIDRETEAKMSIARRALIILAIGVMGLLPAMMCVIMGPMIVDILPDDSLPAYLRPGTPTPTPRAMAPDRPGPGLVWTEPGGLPARVWADVGASDWGVGGLTAGRLLGTAAGDGGDQLPWRLA